MESTKPKLLKLALELVVFGLLIAFGIGLVGFLVIPAAYGHWRTRNETTVFAKLTSVEERQISSKRRNLKSTIATFVYEFGGQEYSSNQISIWRSTGQFYHRLNTAWRTDERIQVFVDPNDASYAVYDRDLFIWPSAAATLMAFVSCGMGVHGFWWRHQQNKQAKTLQR